MPEDVRAELQDANLLADYNARPFYQRNDYLAWIGRAKQPATRLSRLTQMINELSAGGIYMKMSHPPSAKNDPGGRPCSCSLRSKLLNR